MPAARSVVVQARLHPDVPDEKKAIAIFDSWIDYQHKPRAILCRALLALGDEIMPPSNEMLAVQQAIEGLRDNLIDAISALLDEKLDEIAIMQPTERREFVREEVKRRSSFGSSISKAINIADFED